MVSQEFQAVVLAAGRGTRLPEVVGNTPKCLLPIGPYPLIWYPLNLLQHHNMQETIIIVLESERSEIQMALDRLPLKMKLDLVSIPTESDFGTADSLRYIHDKIQSDFLVLSCDIVSNVCLYPLVRKFRQHNASLAALLFKSGFESDVTLPGPKIKHKPERDLIGIHPETKRLLFLASASDFEEVMSVNAHLLRKNGKMTVYSRLIDSHIYVIKKWVLDYLEEKEHFSTLKGEFLPYLIKKQMIKSSGISTLNTSPVSDTQSELGTCTKQGQNIFGFIPNTSLDQQILKTSLYNDNRTKPVYNGDLLRCYALEAPKETIGVRVNTTLLFFAINQKLTTIWPLLCGGQDIPLISPNSVMNSTQTKEIAVADNAKLSEKTSLNFSIFGPNCFINTKNIINKSVIMAHAVIEEGCNIENCIIGPKAVIKKGTKLKNCLVGANFIVEEGSLLEAKHLTHTDCYMEIDIL